MMKKLSLINLTLILFLVLAMTNYENSNAAPAPKYFAYVANASDNNISAFSINPRTGVLTQIKGSPFPAGTSPNSMVAHSTGKFIYVANYQSHDIFTYSVNAATGALTALKVMPIAKKTPVLVTMAPSGKFIYVLTDPDSISVYEVNIMNGSLSEIKGSPFAIESGTTHLTIAPTGNLAFTTNYNRNSVTVYSVSTTTGALTKIKETPIKSGRNPRCIAIDPTGKFAVIANYYSSDLSVYAVNSQTGALTAIKSGPFGADRPTEITFVPSGKFAYILNCEDVSGYSINPTTGMLAKIKGSPFYGTLPGEIPSSLTCDPTHKFFYVTLSESRDIAAFSINPTTGELTEIEGSPFEAGSNPGSIVTVKQ